MLSTTGLGLVQSSLNACFYHKRSLKNFLRRSGVKEDALARLDGDTTKREFIDWLMPKLEISEKGKIAVRRMAGELATMESFPDADSPRAPTDYVPKAKSAVKTLRDHLDQEKRECINENDRISRRQRAEQERLKNLSFESQLQMRKDELDKMYALVGTSKGGYAFEKWFYDLASLFELDHARPYKSDSGRQIDGSVTIDGMSYLVSLKFKKSQCEPHDVSDHRDKVNDVVEYTMGIIVAISGFTDIAISQASRAKSNLLLFDHRHLYAVLGGATRLDDLIRASKQHASRGKGNLMSI